VTVGTIFEDSHIPLGKWLVAVHMMAASKKGVSAHQLHRMLGITYKTAWFMAHRIRYAMTQEPLAGMLLQGTVEADETFVGGKPENMHREKRKPAPPKTPVLSLVERKGDVRSFKVPNVTGKTLRDALRKNVAKTAKVMTDGHGSYKGLDKEFAAHGVVDHQAGQYVDGDASTNTVEAYFSILKRGITGIYHHVSEYHLHRYLAEFDRRWNTRSARGVDDGQRAAIIVKAGEGKRLTYKPLVKRAQGE